MPSAALLLVAVLLAACGASAAPAHPPGPAPVRSYPAVPTGGSDCGITDELSGWPTTTMAGPAPFACLSGALGAGRPARLVVIRPSDTSSGRTTGDGYAIPAGIVVTYRVLGPGRLEITTDRRDAGGAVTTRHCTGLAPQATDGPPTPTGCTSGR